MADRFTDSAVGTGAATAPTLGAAVATLTTPGTGPFRITVHVTMSGTAEPLTTNLQLKHGSTVVGTIPSAPGAQRIEVERVTVLSGENVTVNAAAAGTAGAIYTVSVVATPLPI